MTFQAVFVGKLFLTYRARVSPGTAVSRQVIVVVRTNRVAFAALLAMIAGQLLVYVFDVFPQSAAADERAEALRTGQACASVYSVTVRNQLAFHPKRRSTVNALVSEMTVGRFGR